MAEGNEEQDLVKALDNVAGAASEQMAALNGDAYSAPSGAVASPFGSTPAAPAPQPAVPPLAAAPYLTPDPTPAPTTLPTPSDPPAPEPVPEVAPAPQPAPVDDGPLASIKQNALVELRPLVDKLNVSPEEKFDTYLLLIRSTDDTDLIGPAHDAAGGPGSHAPRGQ